MHGKSPSPCRRVLGYVVGEMNFVHIKIVRIVLPVILGVVCFLLYSPGLSGSLFYDDRANLDALSTIDGWDEGKNFVLGGQAGPLGRPVALATFLLHADGWPDTLSDALRFNVLLHIANAGLLLVLGYLCLQLHDPVKRKANYYIALSAASIWMVMPVLASTSLIAVQRMTGLATFFGLVGLIIFVGAYRLQVRQPGLALVVQMLGLGIGTLLSMLSKETGALIPVYALLIDSLLLKHVSVITTYQRIRTVLLWICLLAILYFLSPFFRDWTAAHPYREFTPTDRLMTQFVILWQYIGAAFLPRPTAFGPFHDHVQLAVGWIGPALSAGAFLVLAWIGVVIRKRNPWFLFGLLWFLGGHLLESTSLLLELYFEHRNYLPLYGLCLALAHSAWTAQGALARLAPGFFSVYWFVLAGTLFGVTALWGQGHQAAESWATAKPGSARAALFLSTFENEALPGATFVDAQGERRAYANRALDRTAMYCPNCVDIRLQALLFACNVESPTAVRSRFDDLLRSSASGGRSFTVIDGVFPIVDILIDDYCPPLTIADADAFIELVLRNPQFAAPRFQARLRFSLARLANAKGDHDQLMHHLAEGEKQWRGALPILQYQVHSFVAQGKYSEARAAVARRADLAFEQAASEITVDVLNELEKVIDDAENVAG